MSEEIEAREINVGKYRAQGVIIAAAYGVAIFLIVKIGEMRNRIDILEDYKFSTNRRIDYLEKVIEKMRRELADRDAPPVPTKKV